ncbi:MAG TPA: GTP 3',8-cyclase MoaA [Chloroflexi bacterium]|nr:GTP 3',8-cyclase MoaA [Chloroflexota bacterium]HBY08612.1 GTP 3',8-cyclase MoaA [Chloroflexota bacterium]
MTLTDTFNRPLRDLRISVTDLCNYRCPYCMPKEIFGSGHHFLPKAELLTFEEITRLASNFAAFGVRKIRLTGGEPLIRHGIEVLVGMLKQIPGLELAMTTNGSLLAQKAEALKKSGLDRLTISLDALDDTVYRQMNDVNSPLEKVLQGIAAAEAAGFGPLKFNMVVKRGMNDQQVVELARHFRGTGHIVRFIEYMDVGNSNGWRLDEVVSAQEIVAAIGAEFPLEPAKPNYHGEVANRWRYRDGAGEIGVIASVTQPFCGSCTRARLSATGQLYTCLFATNGHDLRAMLRLDFSDDQIREHLQTLWQLREDRYSEIRSAATSQQPKIEMSYIGG